MSNDHDYECAAFKAMGSVLVRLPFSTSLKSMYADSFTGEEEAALQHSLQIAIATLMRSRNYYQLGDDAIEACAAGVACELVRVFIASRHDRNPPKQRMHVDDHEWELMFDPGPTTNGLRTDEKGRVWRNLQHEDDEFDVDAIPF